MRDLVGFDEIAKKFATLSPDVFKKTMGEGVKSPTKKFTELMNRLIELDEQEGKFDEKISCLDSLDELKPGHPAPWYYKGVTYTEQENYEEALKCWDKAYELEKNLVRDGNYNQPFNDDMVENIWFGKSIALGELGRHQEALTCIDQAIKLNKTETVSWSTKGKIHLLLGQREGAMRCFTKVTEMDPKSDLAYEAWDNLGSLFTQQRSYEKAFKCFDKAIELNPIGEGWYNKGLLFAELDKHEEAIECYDKATKGSADPEFDQGDAWNNMGIEFHKLGKHEEAIKCWDKVIEVSPTHEKIMHVWNHKAETFKILDRDNEALYCRIKMVRLDPDRTRASLAIEAVFGDSYDENLSDEELLKIVLQRQKRPEDEA